MTLLTKYLLACICISISFMSSALAEKNILGEEISIIENDVIDKDPSTLKYGNIMLSEPYLFGVETPGYKEDFFEKHDVSWVVACGIRFNKSIGASLRYTTSLMHVYDDPAAAERILKSRRIKPR
ncbi:MAG: hypothetical protein RJA27_505 [Pseudomonadota bacterium]